jgi:hypothetical protein
MNILERWQKGKPRNKTDEAVFVFLDELMFRKGFDAWWNSVEENTQIEILESLVESIGKIH